MQLNLTKLVASAPAVPTASPAAPSGPDRFGKFPGVVYTQGQPLPPGVRGVPYRTPATAPVHAEADWLDPNVINQRNESGRQAEYAPEVVPPGLVGQKAPAYFRTVDQMYAAMHDLSAKYPDLVQVQSIGKSGEGRDILALTITNQKATGTKPVVQHVAGLHAREIANPEMLLAFATKLAAGYGVDAEITSLLDTRQVDLVPDVNPDGHVVVEKGFAGAAGGNTMKRKNTTGQDGTDINRNFDWHWGGPGASSSPRNETYRGAGAASDGETQAVQAFAAARKPAMFTDWHSYSRLDMYPWGDTRDKAPDFEGLKNVALKYASYNHYSPEQSIDLYPTTGTSDDWAYGAHKIPAWAVETGDSFLQSDKEFAATLSENLPILQWTLKAANDPFAAAKAADVSRVLVDAASKTVSASITAPTVGGATVTGAEAVLDPAAPAGSGTPLAVSFPKGGLFGGSPMASGALAAIDGAKAGQMVYVRAQDSAGAWGPLTAQWLVAPAAKG